MAREIQSSHLALRFYRASNWNEELLKSCMTKGKLRFFDDVFGDHDMAYWVGEVGTVFDADKLLAVSGEVHHYKGHIIEGQLAKDYIKEMNW